MRYLLVSDQYPWPLHHGTYLRIYNLAKSLAAAGNEIALAATEPSDENFGSWSEFASEIHTCSEDRSESRELYKPNNNLVSLLGREIEKADCCVCFHARSLIYGQTVKKKFPNCCMISDLIDDYALEQRRRLKSDLPNIIKFARRVKYIGEHVCLERRYLNIFDSFSFVGDSDARNFARRHNIDIKSSHRCVSIANGVDTARFDHVSQPVDLTGGKFGPSVVFLGRFVHPPNVEAANFLIKKIAPLIRRVNPRLKVVLLGADPPKSLQKQACDNVIVTGFVEDMPAALAGCDVAAICMKSGTGMKNKLLEAWAAKVPVVATTLACQGIDEAEDGQNLLIADSAGEFAAACLRLFAHPPLREKIISAGRHLVETSYSWAASAEKLQILAGQILSCKS